MKEETHQSEELLPKVELDEEDMQDFLEETYYLLCQVSERKLPKELRKDVLSLLTRIDEVISWSRLH